MSFAPTPEQTAITEAAAAGESLRVIALAGCAKSTTIRLAAKALPAKRTVAILAFNKKIKEEMEKSVPPNVTVLTLNGLGHRAIQAASRVRLKVDPDKMYKIAGELSLRGEDRTGARDLAKAARAAGLVPRGSVGKGIVPDTDEVWEGLAEELDLPKDLIPSAREILLRSNKAALQGTIDYDDQIYISTLVFGQYPRFDTVFVDEAQDLSPFNHTQLRRCVKDQLIAVGDPNQAIYAWRGADHESMDTLLGVRPMRDLHLSTTFRCPRKIVERQRTHVPLFRAAPGNPEGEINFLDEGWSPARGAAVLCRNNAPLIKLSFALLKAGRSVNYLGRDIGKDLKRVYKKLNPEGRRNRQETIELALHRAELEQDENKADRLLSLAAVLESHSDVEDAMQYLSSPKADAVILSTGHRAKGLEWPTVYHLNPQLIPSRRASGEAELTQERNLRYVIETRAQNSLNFVQGDDVLL